jgi:uncharacterized lipoprotein YddW (UPF0748 family)
MLQAVWLTNVDSQVMNSHHNLAEGLQRLAELGFNTIYPTVWQRGYTLYPSEVAKQLSGSSVLPHSPFEDRDVLAEIIELAQPLQMRVIPWFEYGLMVPPQSAIAQNHRDLLTLNIDRDLQRIQGANRQRDPNAWLNPCHQQVRQFMVDLITDVVQRYDVAGIQLDDHFSFPQELGSDRLTQQLFQQDNLGINTAIKHDHEIWIEWGAAQLTELLSQIVGSVKSVQNDCVISIAPNPLKFSRTRYLADWQQWHDLGLMDELVLQVYRDRLDLFKLELNKPEVRAIRTKIPTLIGILTGLKTRSIDISTIELQVNAIIDRQFGGLSCFFYETLFHEQLSPELVCRSKEQLLKIFGAI